MDRYHQIATRYFKAELKLLVLVISGQHRIPEPGAAAFAQRRDQYAEAAEPVEGAGRMMLTRKSVITFFSVPASPDRSRAWESRQTYGKMKMYRDCRDEET